MASQWLVAGCEVRTDFASRRDVFGADACQDLLSSRGPLRVVAVDREQCPPLPNATFVALGLVFGNAHSDQRSDDPTDYAARADARQRAQGPPGGLGFRRSRRQRRRRLWHLRELWCVFHGRSPWSQRCRVDYAAMPNSSAMKCAWPTASPLASHLTLPFRIMATASIPCKVRQALWNEP